MPFLIDTNVAIHLRDGDEETISRLRTLGERVFMSVISRVELEGGASPPSPDALDRRRRLTSVFTAVPVLSYDARAADAYRTIVQAAGFARRKVIDRMIAGHALSVAATLVTYNGADFEDVPGLQLLAW